VSRHDVDIMSLIAGLVFVAVGVAYLLSAMDVIEVEAKWVVPLALIGLGVAGLAGSLLRMSRGQRTDLGTQPGPDPADDPDDYPAEPERPAV
jgi:hypothetical protein